MTRGHGLNIASCTRSEAGKYKSWLARIIELARVTQTSKIISGARGVHSSQREGKDGQPEDGGNPAVAVRHVTDQRLQENTEGAHSVVLERGRNGTRSG